MEWVYTEDILVSCVASKHPLHGVGVHPELTRWEAQSFSAGENASCGPWAGTGYEKTC